MNDIETLLSNATSIESKIGYRFKDRNLLILAFIHRSYINENRQITKHNERLEFLGDSVLGLIISDYLYHTFPNVPEGELSNFRSKIVEASSCMGYVQKFDLGQQILLGKGERMNDGRGRDSILADLFEAIIGAIYLDGGIEEAKKFIFSNFTAEMQKHLDAPLRNAKAILQDYCQKKFQQTPSYKMINEFGPDHSKIFEISVLMEGQELGKGSGSSKKEAQQAAATDALSRINISED